MTRMSPPRTPKGERPIQTIMFQNRQIEMLCQRVEDLTSARDTAVKLAAEYASEIERLRAENNALTANARAERDARIHLEGYRTRVQELDAIQFHDCIPPQFRN